MFCLSSCRWFMLCLACIPYLVLVQVSEEKETSSINWAQLNRFYLKAETESSLRNIVFLDKNKTVDTVQKHSICINIPLSQTFRSFRMICQRTRILHVKTLFSYSTIWHTEICNITTCTSFALTVSGLLVITVN
jgi:hypothetical protein